MNVLLPFISIFYFISQFFLFTNFLSDDKKSTKTPECGVESYTKSVLEKKPHLKPENNAAYKTLEQLQNKNNKTSSSRYIIPVVVHIVHDFGLENLNSGAIIGGIADLNAAMRLMTQNNEFIHPNFDGIKTDTEIEFILARYDPDGNPTGGILRHRNSFYTQNGNSEGMRLDYHWPRSMYLNIYIVRQPFPDSASSGFATFPYLVNNAEDAYLDGIVLAYWAFGRHNNLYKEWYYLVAHEVGHWLNLRHTWGADEDNSCDEDDGIPDTPNTTGNVYVNRSECSNTSFQCNTLDNITNMMDYASPCQAMFTTDQTTRMHNVLNSPIADRNNIHSPQNLAFTLGFAIEEVCEDEILILDNSLTTENIAANNSITTNGLIQNTYSIALNAADKIRLLSGFKVEAGATFKAYNFPCSSVNQ